MKNGADKMFFKKQQQQLKQTEYTQFAPSTTFGRGVSSIQSAKVELFHPAKPFNPLHFLDESRYFLGLDHETGEPIYLPNKDVVHFLITAPTRSGKGIFFGIKAIETIRKNKGLIVIDPKEDEWLPQIILEELMRQGREDDLIIWNWESDFSYKVFEFDDYIEASKKLTIMLNLIEVENEAGASHYRKIKWQRTSLKNHKKWERYHYKTRYTRLFEHHKTKSLTKITSGDFDTRVFE